MVYYVSVKVTVEVTIEVTLFEKVVKKFRCLDVSEVAQLAEH